MDIPRLRSSSVPAEIFDECLTASLQKLHFDFSITDNQREIIFNFIRGKDVFVSLPTGAGKSLCFAVLPYLFDFLKSRVSSIGELAAEERSIVVVVSPLISLMKDQVAKFSERGLACTFVGGEQEDVSTTSNVLCGRYQLVYMSPESLLCVLKWREMFRSPMYEKNLVAIVVDEAHCVREWGATFRHEFSNISEVRSIIPKSVNCMALTATATVATRREIIANLCMQDCYEVVRSPNKLNIRYSVELKPEDALTAFLPLIESVENYGVESDRYIVFCSTYTQCSTILHILVDKLGKRKCLFPLGSTKPICNIFTASSAKKDKNDILEEFAKADGVLRILVATIAFGMGVDTSNIRHVIHWGAPHTIEMYVQESGRCGRDGLNSTSTIYYTGTDFAGFSTSTADVRAYCLNTVQCRRQQLMAHFVVEAAPVGQPELAHDCCDICAKQCNCQLCVVQSTTVVVPMESTPASILSSTVKHMILASLLSYRDMVVSGSVPLYGVEVSSGIPDCILREVVDNATSLSMSYLLQLGISDKHAVHILRIVNSHF